MPAADQPETRSTHARKIFPPRHVLAVLIAAALVLVSLPLPVLEAQTAKPTAYDVEAAYLFNFGKFVTWPQKNHPPGDSFLICILGDDPFGPILDKTTAGATVGGKKVIDKRVSRPQDALGCSIVFISSSEEPRLSKILAVVQGSPVLTVSDMPGFVEHGGMIQFVVDNGRVRFKVNLRPAEQDGLALSSELLKVAVNVTPAGTQEDR
jgi:YfiR/HmsC-like